MCWEVIKEDFHTRSKKTT